MKLYEITNNYMDLLQQIFDPDTGEIINNIELLNDVSKDFNDKAIAIASYIGNLKAETNAIKEAREQMERREKQIKRQYENLENYLQLNMEKCSITEIKCSYFVIKLKKCPVSVDVVNESEVPEDYKNRKEVVSIDKNKVKADILNGVCIPGVSLKNNLRLQIN